ncbi:MAG: sigma factor-like helix-turn-helix DNA-binding protein [archaeon]
MANRDNILTDTRFLRATTLLRELAQEYKISPEDILGEIEKRERSIPTSVFNKKLSPLETVSKFLREDRQLSIKSIAKLTQRSEKTVWQALNAAKQKMPEPLVVDLTKPCFPIPKLQDRSLSILEHIVLYMKDELNLKYSQIAELLQRDDRTIWTVYSRAKKKRDEQKPKTKKKPGRRQSR